MSFTRPTSKTQHAFFFARQLGLCYLQLSGTCRVKRRGVMPPPDWKWRDKSKHLPPDFPTWEHVLPNCYRMGGEQCLVLLACHECNHLKKDRWPDLAHVEIAIDVMLDWFDVQKLTHAEIDKRCAAIDRQINRAAQAIFGPSSQPSMLRSDGVRMVFTETGKARPIPRDWERVRAMLLAQPQMQTSLAPPKPKAEKLAHAKALGATDPRFLPAAGTGDNQSQRRAAIQKKHADDLARMERARLEREKIEREHAEAYARQQAAARRVQR